MKTKLVFAWLLHYWGWLSYPLLRSRWSNSDIIIAWDHLKLVDRVYIFHLNLTLLNLEVSSFIFIRLKLSSRLVKIVKTEMQADERRVIHLSSLSLNDTLFRVLNLGFDKFQLSPYSFNYTRNCLQTYNFMQFYPCQTQLAALKLTAIFILVHDSKFVHFDPQLTWKF